MFLGVFSFERFRVLVLPKIVSLQQIYNKKNSYREKKKLALTSRPYGIMDSTPVSEHGSSRFDS